MKTLEEISCYEKAFTLTTQQLCVISLIQFWDDKAKGQWPPHISRLSRNWSVINRRGEGGASGFMKCHATLFLSHPYF